MANVSLKTDFIDGEKLFAQQLNNNFSALQAALNAMNKIVWQDDPDDMVTTFRGNTAQIAARDIIDGQLLYNTDTGETYIDYGLQRISTGSGNAIHIGSSEPTNDATQLWIDPTEPLQTIGSEVVDSLSGNETNKAPSVKQVNDAIACSFIRVNTTSRVNITSATVLTNLSATLTKGDFSFDNTTKKVVITNAEFIEVGGNICGKGNAMVYFKIYNEDSESIEHTYDFPKTLDPNGDKYKAICLNRGFITLDKTKTYYLTLTINGYDDIGFYLNNGFSEEESGFYVKKIK